MKKKVHQGRFLLIVLVLFFVALPIIIHAAAPEAATITMSWWDNFKQPFTSFTDTLKALGTLVLNVGTIIALLTTGILPVIGIVAGITYGAMAVLSLIAAGLFESTRGIILSTLDIPIIPGPGAVSVVQEGWRFSRDIASLFFVAILTFIGLATILRLENFQFKKTLPALIIMAFLLNFSGLVVGFVVDMGNLATAVFIQPIRGLDILTGPLGAAATDLLETMKTVPISLMQNDPLTFVTTTLFEPILNAGAKAIFYGALVLMLLLVPLLFILRIGMLWILTVLAPLAFAAYILPQTRSLWSQWWKQLLQWSLMGVPMGFFLLLSMKIASIPIDLSAASETWFGNILVDIIQPLFILLFLVVGFSLSITLVPSAVNAFVSKTAPHWIKEKAWGTAQEKFKTGAMAERMGQWAAKKPALGRVMGKPLLGYAEKRRGEFEVGEKAVQSWRSENIAAQIGRMPELQKAGALKVLAERGHANKIKEEEQIKILMAAKAAGKEKDIIKFLPQYAEKIGFKDGIDGALRAQKPEDIAKLDKSIFDIPEVVNRIPHVYSQGKLAKLADHGPEIINKIQAAFENEYKNNRAELEKNNAPGLRYLNSVMGNSLFKPVGGGSAPTKIATPGSKDFEDTEKAIKERLKR